MCDSTRFVLNVYQSKFRFLLYFLIFLSEVLPTPLVTQRLLGPPHGIRLRGSKQVAQLGCGQIPMGSFEDSHSAYQTIAKQLFVFGAHRKASLILYTVPKLSDIFRISLIGGNPAADHRCATPLLVTDSQETQKRSTGTV